MVGDFNGDGIPALRLPAGLGLGCISCWAMETAVLTMALFVMNLAMEVMAMDLPISTVPD